MSRNWVISSASRTSRSPSKRARWILPSSINSRGPMRPCCCATWWTQKNASRTNRNHLPRIYADSRGSENKILILTFGCLGSAVAADDRSAYFSIRTQHNNVGLRAWSELAVLREADRARGVQGCGAHRFAQGPVRESLYVANRAVHGQDAAGEAPVARALSIFHFHLNRSELVGAVWHAGRGHGVGDQHRAFKAYRPQENLNDLGCNVNSIRDNVGTQFAVGKHFAEDAGIAMIERPHGVESVSGVVGSGVDSGASGFERGVIVANAHTDFAPRRFGDNLKSAGNLRCDGHHPHVAMRGLPKTLKDFERGLDEVFRRMHAAALVAEKRTF